MIATISDLTHVISGYTADERTQILRAAEHSDRLHQGQLRESGEPYFIHPLQVAEILIGMRLDATTVIAALLHDVLEDTKLNRSRLRELFGREVEALVDGVTKIATVKAKNRNLQESETIRKMLLAMVKDVRVILIKLADKLHNMRTLDHKKGPRKREIAQETLDIYALLAGRLGISWLKDELEDLSLKHLQPEVYRSIKDYVAETRTSRSTFLEEAESKIKAAVAEDGLTVKVEGRAKHFYSIYQKMQRRDKAIDELYDLFGIRVLVEDVSNCYHVLGLIHHLWPPIEGRFKDYVAMPKSNQYQSLHTSVLGPGGRVLEVQIRTHHMHQTAEYGVAAHWLYKRGVGSKAATKSELAIMQRVKDLRNAKITSGEFLDEIKREILKDSIYVFTPKGDAIELPKGATAIDFAYHIHTEIGNRVAAAKADGAIVPLKQELRNTQVIEILTSSLAHPRLDWLRYAKTSRARAKVRAWLNHHDDSLIINRNIVARKSTPAPTGTEQGRDRKKRRPAIDPTATEVLERSKVAVRVGDERNLLISFANCCNPATGDDIVGYVSRGRGIIIHRRGCRNVERIPEVDERLIDVEWETVSPKVTLRFRVTARRATDLFGEIEAAIGKLGGHLIEGRIEEADNDTLEAFFTVEIERRRELRRIETSIRAVPAVTTLEEVPAV